MKKLSLYLIVLLLTGITGILLWYVYTATIQTDIHVTIQPHAWLSSHPRTQIVTTCKHILSTIRSPNAVRDYLKTIVPHIHTVWLQWKTPYHVHMHVLCEQPLVYITTASTHYIITQAGNCIPAEYVPRYVHENLPGIVWRDTYTPAENAYAIRNLYNNLPATWWNEHTIIWYRLHDVLLYAKNGKHVRTTADTTVAANMRKYITSLHNKAPHNRHDTNDTWVDIRFPRRLIASNAIRGVKCEKEYGQTQ